MLSAPPVRMPAELVADLTALLRDRFTTSAAVCDHHSRDESYHAAEAPDAVAFPQSTEDVRAIVKACARENGGTGFVWATRPEERAKLWKARHDAYYAALALRPGTRGWTTDVCVPISRLTEAVTAAQKDLAASPLKGALVGHVGDGNFHMVYLVDPARAEEIEEARRLTDLMVRRALEAGGTCTGEHGIGMGKIDYLGLEHGEAVEVMRDLKHVLDPLNLMNPGKMLRA